MTCHSRIAWGTDKHCLEPGTPGNECAQFCGPQAWGHSTVVGPWADIVASVSEQPVVIYADLDMDRVEVREGV